MVLVSLQCLPSPLPQAPPAPRDSRALWAVPGWSYCSLCRRRCAGCLFNTSHSWGCFPAAARQSRLWLKHVRHFLFAVWLGFMEWLVKPELLLWDIGQLWFYSEPCCSLSILSLCVRGPGHCAWRMEGWWGGSSSALAQGLCLTLEHGGNLRYVSQLSTWRVPFESNNSLCFFTERLIL